MLALMTCPYFSFLSSTLVLPGGPFGFPLAPMGAKYQLFEILCCASICISLPRIVAVENYDYKTPPFVLNHEKFSRKGH